MPSTDAAMLCVHLCECVRLSTYGTNFIRPMMEPLMRAGVMTAKAHWKAEWMDREYVACIEARGDVGQGGGA